MSRRANRLAKLYRSGIGVEGDTVQAAAWYLLARPGRIVRVRRWKIFSMASNDDQIAEARERAGTLPLTYRIAAGFSCL